MAHRVVLASAAAVGGIAAARFATMERSDTHTISTATQQFFVFGALKLVGIWARGRHDDDCREFQKVQEEVLHDILERRTKTAYGSEKQFDDMLTSEDIISAFRARHPVTTYSYWSSWVDRIANGEPNVLNKEPEKMLAATSGTSGRRAMLPGTKQQSATFFTRGILVVFDVLRRTVPSCYELQKSCKLAFAPTWTYAPGGLKIGPNSSDPTDPSFRKLLPILYSTPEAGYKISHDEQAAIYIHALFAARDSNLGILEANFVNLPHRLLSVLRDHGHSIANDIEHGRLSHSVAAKLDASVVETLERSLGGGDPRRAQAIRDALLAENTHDAGTRVGLARRVWPNLRLILSNATGASFEPYANQLRSDLATGVPILSTIYAASEGLIGISLRPSLDGQSAYCLVPRAMFFEFLPVPSGEASAAQADGVEGGDIGGDTLLAHELRHGEDYELVVTTLTGLCRYRIGDVVRVVGRHFGAPVVEFRFRRGTILNLHGEKSTEMHLAEALRSVFPTQSESPSSASTIAEYATVEALPPHQLPHYRVYVEREKGSSPLKLETTSQEFDVALGETNPVYGTWRRKGAIGPCEVVEVLPGAFDELRAHRLSGGTSPQQLKPPRVLRVKAHDSFLQNRRRVVES